MAVSDPAGLLGRIPELKALLDDGKIRHAIESGDPFKVFRALMLARLLRRLPQYKALLKELTGQRRLFFKPLKGTPVLHTINSIGFSFVGEAERDRDGSHIAMHAFVIGFVIPIIPMNAYVVMKTESNRWSIYARAPLGIAGWLYTRSLALGAVLLLGIGASHSVIQSTTQDLIVLNGFDQAATVQLQGQTVVVPAQGRMTMTLKTGPVSGTASLPKFGEVDQLQTNMVSSGKLSLWNIAGAAPLLRNTVVYSKHPKEGAEPPQVVYCGSRFLELEHIDYPFTEPPTTMSISKHAESTSVEHLMVPVTKVPGYEVCVGYGMEHKLEAKVARAAEVLAFAHDWEREYLVVALQAAKSVSAAESSRVEQRAAQAQSAPAASTASAKQGTP